MIRNTTLTLMIVASASVLAFGANAQTYETSRVPGSASQKIVSEQRVRQYQAPGNTQQISPDTKETATGGQPGGVMGRGN